jgi:5'-3' exonuclease
MKIEEQQEELIEGFLKDVTAAESPEKLIELGRRIARSAHQSWFTKRVWPRLKFKIDRARNRKPFSHVVIDLSQCIHACWHASSGDSGSYENVPRRVKNIVNTHGAANCILACDSSSNFRRKLLPDWKADRDVKTPEFLEHIKRSEDAVANMQIADIVSIEGFEADDVMASLALTFAIWGDTVILETSDRDCWQALGPAVRMHFKDKWYTRQLLKEDHSITPEQAPEWMTLVGKNGVRGLDGIGQVRASALLNKHSSIREILEKEDLGKCSNLNSFRENYCTLQDAHTLRKYLEIPITLMEGL